MNEQAETILVVPSELEAMISGILKKVSTPNDIAQHVAHALVLSNLRGADSHGALQLPGYVIEIIKGEIAPAARPRTEIDLPGLVVLNGNRGFGIYALWEAGILAIERARKQGAVTIALKNCSHTGRLGHVAEHMAGEGCFAQIMGGGGRHKWPGVAPHGGCEAVLCTNPYAFGMPGGKYGPVVTDFATSAVSEGTISSYQITGQQLPDGCILDKSGHPSKNPDDYFDGGVHLPAAGHKGYGMAIISELLGGIALNTPPEFNWIVTAVDITPLRDEKSYVEDVEKFLDQVKSVKAAPGHSDVLIPGERGNRRALQRSREGVDLPRPVWNALAELADQYQVSLPARA